MIRRVYFVLKLSEQAYIRYVPFANDAGVLGQQERQFGRLESKGIMGMNAHGFDGFGIATQSRGHIHRYDGRAAFVDGFYQAAASPSIGLFRPDPKIASRMI